MNNNNFPFKEGDWIAPNDNGFCIGLITSISDYMCSFENDNGINVMSKEHVKNNYHLWTIKDAQDGDVLVANIHHWEIRGDIENLPVRVPTIFIYREVKTDNKNIYAYVSLFDNTSLDIYNKYYINEYCIKDIHPATSEQRNILWQRMREAGYKWNSRTREVVKAPFKLEGTLFSAADRGTINEIIDALKFLGKEKMISYDREIKFLEKIRKL